MTNLTQQDVNHIMQKGMTALQNRQASEAKHNFQKLVDAGIVNASIWIALAYANRDLGDLEGMLIAVDQSLKLEGRNPRAAILKGDYFDAKGQDDAALSFYAHALKLAPPPDKVPADLAPELVRAQQRYEAAIERMEQRLIDTVKDQLQDNDPETKRVRYAVDFLLSKKHPMTQQPKVFYFPGLPDIEFYDNTLFPWIKDLEAAYDDIKAELAALIAQKPAFDPYLQSSEERPQHDIHGMIDNDNWSAFYLWQNGEEVAENAALCPKTMAALTPLTMPKIKGQSPNVLFSKLKPGAKIPPHNGLINTRVIGHLGLIIPDSCGFRVGHETRAWQEGKVWIFDDTIEHEAWNNGSEDRYILLFEVWKPELSDTEKSLLESILENVDHNE